MFAITRDGAKLTGRFKTLPAAVEAANDLAKLHPCSLFQVIDNALGVVLATCNKPAAAPAESLF